MPQRQLLGAVGGDFEACCSMPQHAAAASIFHVAEFFLHTMLNLWTLCCTGMSELDGGLVFKVLASREGSAWFRSQNCQISCLLFHRFSFFLCLCSMSTPEATPTTAASGAEVGIVSTKVARLIINREVACRARAGQTLLLSLTTKQKPHASALNATSVHVSRQHHPIASQTVCMHGPHMPTVCMHLSHMPTVSMHPCYVPPLPHLTRLSDLKVQNICQMTAISTFEVCVR